MKNFILKTKKSFIICFLLSSVCAFAQTTHTVNNNANTSADFTDLQAAIDAAANGDIIYVQQSATSYGEITINKGLTIIGRSNGDASYKSEVGRIYLDAGASNTGNIIRSSITIYTNTSNVLITNNIILSSALYFYMTDTLLFSNNVFGYYAGVGIYNYASSLLNISNSIFTSNYYGNNITTTLSNQGGGTIQVDNCLTYDYYGSGSNNFSTGAGITINSNVQENIDPLFTAVDVNSSNSIANVGTNNFDPINDDLTLQAGSPVIDDGLFEGYNFKNFGTPTGYPSIKVLANSATVPKNGNLSVTIEAKTN